MADILVRDRERLEDALVEMIRNADEWNTLWNFMMYGVGVDDVTTNVELETVVLHCRHMSFDDFVEMFPEEFKDIFEDVTKDDKD